MNYLASFVKFMVVLMICGVCALAIYAVVKAQHQRPIKPTTFTCTHSQWEAGECEPETITCYRINGKAVCP